MRFWLVVTWAFLILYPASSRADIDEDAAVSAGAEALDSWPNPARGHKPGSVIGTKESHRCLEVGWANAANTPFREHKMWVHEGGISTPLVVSWPAGVACPGTITNQVGHIIDLMPTFLELAGATYPQRLDDRPLTPLVGKSLVHVLRGGRIGTRALGWEHEGNRAIRVGDWKLVARHKQPWELYDMRADRTELNDLATKMPEEVRKLSTKWGAWANRAGVLPYPPRPGAK